MSAEVGNRRNNVLAGLIIRGTLVFAAAGEGTLWKNVALLLQVALSGPQ